MNGHLEKVKLKSKDVLNTAVSINSNYFRLQDERMELIKKLLQQRETDHAALNDRKMEQLWYVCCNDYT